MQIPAQLETTQFYTTDDYHSVVKYDVHLHVNTYDPTLIGISEADNFRLLSINLQAPGFPPLEEQHKISMHHLEKHPDHFSYACNFLIDTWNSDDWLKSTIDYLQYALSNGAVAVKVWKNIGMELKDPSGNFVMIDHPRFDAVIEFIIEQGIPLIGHLGEPRNCWLPLEQMTVDGDRNYFRENPQYHMYLHPEYPSYEEQLSARDRLLTKFPGLNFVGAHLASLEWSVEELALRLDRHPNLMVDTAERISHLQLQAATEWQKVYDFFIKYQDRIMYGTDIVDDGIQNTETLREEVRAIRKRHWLFFTSGDRQRTHKVKDEFSGLHLPRKVVDKIYRLNAEKIFFKKHNL